MGFDSSHKCQFLFKICNLNDFVSKHPNIYNVAEQIDKCINVKNPPNCVGGIRVLIRVSFLASRLLALLRNTSIQFTLLVYYFLVFYSGDTTREY
jgi:hypothetical protein